MPVGTAGAVVLPSTGAEFAQHIVHGVTESNWEEEEDDGEDPALLQMSDAEWAHTAKVTLSDPVTLWQQDAAIRCTSMQASTLNI